MNQQVQPAQFQISLRTILSTIALMCLLLGLIVAGQYQAAAGLWGGVCGLLIWGLPNYWSLVGATAGGLLVGQAVIVMQVIGRWTVLHPEDCARYVFVGSLLGAGIGLWAYRTRSQA